MHVHNYQPLRNVFRRGKKTSIWFEEKQVTFLGMTELKKADTCHQHFQANAENRWNLKSGLVLRSSLNVL